MAAQGQTQPRRSEPPLVVVGSSNPIKVGAVVDVLSALGPPLSGATVEGLSVDTQVPPQPVGAQTIAGAVARARAAAHQRPTHLLAVGIEAGLLPAQGLPTPTATTAVPQPPWWDVQYCAVLDRAGALTVGHGSGFAYPPAVVSQVLDDGLTVGEAAHRLLGRSAIGSAEGMIGYLTQGRLNRQALTAQAVLMAFVPRILHREYGLQRPW